MSTITPNSQPPQADLEKQMKQLELMIKQLEKPETGLVQGVQLFEDSVALYRSCKEQLKALESKITEISKELEN